MLAKNQSLADRARQEAAESRKYRRINGAEPCKACGGARTKQDIEFGVGYCSPCHRDKFLN